MKNFKQINEDISFDDWDEIDNPGPVQTEFQKITEKALTRRNFLKSSAAFSAAAFLFGTTTLTPTDAKASSIMFDPVAANTFDDITLPKGFSSQVVVSWGDPMWTKGKDFDHSTRGTAASQELAYGDNNDGMSLFTKNGKHVLAVNNEYTNRGIIYGARDSKLPENEDDVNKGKAAHGVSIIEISENNGQWRIIKDSYYNRRITADTEMEITGPARGHDLLKTKADPTGTKSLGTWNNCGNGRTPWGTYLACEENFNGYFSSSNKDFKRTSNMKRYGIKNKDWGYAWASVDERFDISKHQNEPNRSGYIVEIDPFNPNSTPKKRTALGRFKHENAEVTISKTGHIVVYLGDDERGEFLYRFVSKNKYDPIRDNSNLLEDGSLYVAKFNDDGSGQWLELNPTTTGISSQAEVCVNTRVGASTVGATTMDRPEWVASNPTKVEVYCALTNNKNRGKKSNAGGDNTPVNGPNPRQGNKFGQIVRWIPDNEDHTAKTFKWDLYVVAGNPDVHTGLDAGSSNIKSDNMFNSPDGIAFDKAGNFWIQTDGNYSNKKDFYGMGNNQMLLGDTRSGEIKRFLVGPNECEVTGITWSDDGKTMFVGIQHPGEKGNSHWPAGGKSVPRSSIVAIKRNDGNKIGENIYS